jgi:hypothetical protein
VPPVIDVYVWVPTAGADVLTAFIDRYVDTARPGDDRLDAFVRAYVDGTADAADRAALADLRRSDDDPGFSLYLRARGYDGAIITVTDERAVVLGLSLDDPDASPIVAARARALLDRLRDEFDAPAGCAGTELAPPHSREEWVRGDMVQWRSGALP